MFKQPNRYIFPLLLLFFIRMFALVFYSNPDDQTKYVATGLYPENKFTKKVPLNTNWQFMIEGEEEWKDIYIPSAYDNFDIDKKIYFRTNFFLGGAKSADRNYKLVFYGINYKCNVKVNDIFIENHSSLNSFEINLDKNHLNFSATNTLLIEVSNKLSETTIPSLMQVDGWRNYGGIFRDVYLVITSQIYISNTDIKYYFNSDYSRVNAEIISEINDNNYIRVSDEDSVHYENNIYAYYEIRDLKTNSIVMTSEKKDLKIHRFENDEVRFDLEITYPKLWSPEEPNLYMCSVYLGRINDIGKETDFNRYDLNFGFKDLRITDNKFFLNGQEYFIKGVARYEDVKNMGNAITYSKMKNEIERIKNLGSNTLYCNGYAPHPYIMDLCDKYGIFVLIEIPVNSAPTSSLRSKDFVSQSTEILDRTLKRDKNRVCLFALGLGFGYNVFDLQAVDFIKDLSDRSKEINDEIFTFITSEYTDYEEYYKITDFNVIMLNNYLPEDEIRTLADKIGKKAAHKTVIVNNRLSRVYPGNQNGWDDPYSEPAQAKKMLNSYELVMSEEEISGILVDSFRDRRSDVTLLTNKPGDDLHILRNGLIDYEGSERLSFRVLDALFKNRPLPALAKGEYNKPEVNLYFIVGLLLTLIYLYMTKREHYLLINSVRSVKNPDAFFIDIRDRRITQFLPAFFISILSAYGVSAVFSTIFYSYRQEEKFDFFLTHFIRNDIFKKFLAFSAWEPALFIISSILTIMIVLFLIAMFIKFISIFFNTRYSLPIAVSMVMWNAIVFLPFVPFSAVFLRIFSPFSVKIILLLFVFCLLWFIIRIFLIMAISFKTTVRKVIWMNFLIILTVSFLWVYFYDINLPKIIYFFHIMNIL